jgi:hypothetical protein
MANSLSHRIGVVSCKARELGKCGDQAMSRRKDSRHRRQVYLPVESTVIMVQEEVFKLVMNLSHPEEVNHLGRPDCLTQVDMAVYLLVPQMRVSGSENRECYPM